MTEGRSIYSWLSFGTTAEMFRQCFVISACISVFEAKLFRGFAPRSAHSARRVQVRDCASLPCRPRIAASAVSSVRARQSARYMAISETRWNAAVFRARL
jgi:hypothetical protein